jgi:hypothetical protein
MVGIPEIIPAVVSVIPGGKLKPAARERVYGALPPEALIAEA